MACSGRITDDTENEPIEAELSIDLVPRFRVAPYASPLAHSSAL